MKSVKYIIFYFIIIQLFIPFYFSFEKVFPSRMDYEVVKDNIRHIDTVLSKIQNKIKKDQLENYIVIIGDSVPYSGPGNATQSTGYYMQQLSKQKYGPDAPVIFNLSMPAMQSGDFYTMLLKLDHYQISTENLIVNVAYSSFLDRPYGPSIVFWLMEDLKELDEASYTKALTYTNTSNVKEETNLFEKFQHLVAEGLSHVPIYKYKDYILRELEFALEKAKDNKYRDDSLGDARPWAEKAAYLRELMQKPEYLNGFSDAPFDMSMNNPQLYFLEKIIQHQANKNTLVFLIGTNDELMKTEVTKQGYVDNLNKIDRYFSEQPVTFINMQGKINQQYFTDHVHLTSDGYKQLSRTLWDEFEEIRGK